MSPLDVAVPAVEQREADEDVLGVGDVVAVPRFHLAEEPREIRPPVRHRAADRVDDGAERQHLAAVDQPLQEHVEDIAIRVRDARLEDLHRAHPGPRGRKPRLLPGPLHRVGVLEPPPVAPVQRPDRATHAGHAHALVELLDQPGDVVFGLEHGVGVEDHQDVRVELARLALECDRLADRLVMADDGEGQAVSAERGVRGVARRRADRPATAWRWSRECGTGGDRGGSRTRFRRRSTCRSACVRPSAAWPARLR